MGKSLGAGVLWVVLVTVAAYFVTGGEANDAVYEAFGTIAGLGFGGIVGFGFVLSRLKKS